MYEEVDEVFRFFNLNLVLENFLLALKILEFYQKLCEPSLRANITTSLNLAHKY